MRSRAKSYAVFSRRRLRHLAINAKTTLQNIAKCGEIYYDFCRKKQRTNAKSEQSKGRGLEICRRRKIHAMIGVELRPYG